jgi:hypothetical protein
MICAHLELGRWVFPAPGERGIEIEDVPFSLVLCFIFVFVLDVNRLLDAIRQACLHRLRWPLPEI